MRARSSRLTFRWGFLLLVAVLLIACAPAAEPTPAEEPGGEEEATEEPVAEIGGELSVLEWAGYEIPDMWADFGAAYPDVEVTFNFGASDPDIYAKVLEGSSEDVIHFYTPYLGFYVDQGLIQPIDTSRLTNWDKVPDGFKESCTVDGQVYCIPWDWGYSSLLYNTEQIPEGVDSWEALFDEKYAGHVSMWDDGPSAVSVSCYISGCDQQNLSDEQLDEIKQQWIEQKPLNAFYWVDEPTLEAAFQSGEVWLAYAWNGAFYRLLSADVPVAYADPSEGRNSWIGQYAISAKTENYDAALAFLDGKLGSETARHLLVDYAYGHPVPEYFSFVEDPLLVQALSLDDPGILDRTNFTVPITEADHQRFIEMWAEVQAAAP